MVASITATLAARAASSVAANSARPTPRWVRPSRGQRADRRPAFRQGVVGVERPHQPLKPHQFGSILGDEDGTPAGGARCRPRADRCGIERILISRRAAHRDDRIDQVGHSHRIGGSRGTYTSATRSGFSSLYRRRRRELVIDPQSIRAVNHRRSSAHLYGHRQHLGDFLPACARPAAEFARMIGDAAIAARRPRLWPAQSAPWSCDRARRVSARPCFKAP